MGVSTGGDRAEEGGVGRHEPPVVGWVVRSKAVAEEAAEDDGFEGGRTHAEGGARGVEVEGGSWWELES